MTETATITWFDPLWTLWLAEPRLLIIDHPETLPLMAGLASKEFVTNEIRGRAKNIIRSFWKQTEWPRVYHILKRESVTLFEDLRDSGCIQFVDECDGGTVGRLAFDEPDDLLKTRMFLTP